MQTKAKIRQGELKAKGSVAVGGGGVGAIYRPPSDEHCLSNEMGLENNLGPPPAINDRYKLFFLSMFFFQLSTRPWDYARHESHC